MSFKKLLQKGLDVFLAPAEDPREKYPDVDYQHKKLLKQVSRAILQVAAFKHSLIQRKELLEKKLPVLLQKAQRAVAADQEELARSILTRRQGLLKESETLGQQILDNENELAHLQLAKQKIETQLEKLRNRQQVLTAQYSVAEAQVQLKESLSGLSDSLMDAGLSLHDAEHRTAAMQARALAFDEMLEIGVLEVADGFETDFVSVELGLAPDDAVEDLLNQLRDNLKKDG